MYKRTHHKKVIENQEYDQYWKLTVEYSNIHGESFRDTLRIIIRFMDENEEVIKNKEKTTSVLYKELQERVASVFEKVDGGSVRKSINQFVKLGFVKPHFKSYHKLSKRFLNASTNEQREIIFSQIYYISATLSSAITVDHSDTREINFLLKTLMYHPLKKLTEKDIISLMNTDISQHSKGYLSKTELERRYEYAKLINFDKKKYNQIGYFYRFLKLVPGLTVDKRDVMYTEDASEILSGSIDTTRDPLMFRIMKENLKMESRNIYGKEVCYFTKMETKGLVTSHIWRSEKALSDMNIEAAYDYRNALLLEQNVDAYFDKYDLTFNDVGTPFFGKEVTKDFKERHQDDKLDYAVLDEYRLKYMTIHNQEYLKKHPTKSI